jgi:outer membrane receptor for ferrienterochelin and colicins
MNARAHSAIQRLSAWLLALTLAISAGTAAADEASEAHLQFELGAELYRQGRYVEAIDRFLASNRLAPNANRVLNVARTFAYLKRPLEAYNWYSTYLEFEHPVPKREEGEAAQRALLPAVAVLDVRTRPSKAELFIDREELGSTGRSPRRIALEPGAHRVIARLAGHRDVITDISVERGKISELELVLEPLTGTLRVRTSPAKARVRGEGDAIDLGHTPLAVSLPVGERVLVIAAPGFVEQTRTVTIQDGKETLLDVRLSREANTVSVLSVTGNVSAAEVLLDGAVIGRTPLTLAELAPGTRELSIRSPRHEPWTTRALFEPGAATRVRYDLVDPETRPWRGWRLLGYGIGGALVVSGAVTGTLALNANADFDAEPTRDALDRRDSLNLATDALLLSGLVVVAGTLVWDLLTPVRHSNGSVTLSR